MKCVVCAIAKNENPYINEWVKYYLNLGFEQIYLYDNNDKKTDYVGNFIDEDCKNKVTIIDKRDVREYALQHKVYTHCYNSNKFDWCLFCDIDEFLIGIDNINTFLSQEKFKDFNQIRIKWNLFGDDDIIERNIKEPVFGAFKKILNIPEFSSQGKSLIRGGLKNIEVRSCHFASQFNNGKYVQLKSCLPSGKEYINTDFRINADYSNEKVFINHYMTKSLSEFINHKYKRGDALFVNRDIDLTYFWNINIRTKNKINWLQKNNIIEPFKIDLVVPYVNADDIYWQNIFNTYNLKINKESINAKNRFRGQGDFFRYFFRSVDKNLPWINNVFLLVMMDSQVPKWIDRNKVKIITHNQFIPSEYLPTFNSGTIEMFLHNIPGLSEYFLYANDDMYILKNMSSKDFFTEDFKCKLNLIEDDTLPDENHMWWQMCQNNHDIIFESNKAIPYLRLDHEFRPYIRSEIKKCYKENESEILSSISQFRCSKNLTCFLFNLYMFNNNNAIKSKLDEAYIGSDYNDNQIKEGLKKSIVCLNDTSNKINIYDKQIIKEFFKNNFYNKSKYETDNWSDNVNKKSVNIKIIPKNKNVRSDFIGLTDEWWKEN